MHQGFLPPCDLLHQPREEESWDFQIKSADIKYKPIFASSHLSWGCSVQVQWWPARAVQPAPHTNVAVRGVSAPLFSVATWSISPFVAYLLWRASKQKRLCVCPPLLSGAGWHQTRIFQPRAGNYPGWRCSMMMVAGPGGGANTAPCISIPRYRSTCPALVKHYPCNSTSPSPAFLTHTQIKHSAFKKLIISIQFPCSEGVATPQ